MQPVRFFVAVLLSLSITVPLTAQTDSVRLVNGHTWPVSKLKRDGKNLKAKVLGPSNSPHGISADPVSWTKADLRSVTIPLREISSIRFTDGFELPFQDGIPSRSALTSAPTFRSAWNAVYAEGIVQLTQDEIRALYGETLYRYGYRNYRRMFWAGIGKIGAGTVGAVWTHRHDPSEWIMNRYDSEFYEYVKTLTGTDYTRGDLYPGWLAATSFFTGCAISGAVDAFMSGFTQRHLLNTLADWKPLSQKQINARYVGGATMAIVGLGTMTGFSLHLNQNRHWFWRHGENLGEEGQKPVMKTEWVLMTGGAFLLHFGISLMEQGAIESKLRKYAETGSESGSGPYGCQFSLGPAAHGYGLTLTF